MIWTKRIEIDFAYRGFSSESHRMILLGAIPSALLAIIIDRLLLIVEKRFSAGL